VSPILYDNPGSSNAMKVRLLLAEIGEDYERVRVALARPRPDWYLQRYAFGTIPFLEDGDVQMGESNAILRHLARSRERADLYPTEPAARARVDWALDAWSTQIRGGLFGAERIGLMHADMEHGGGRWEDAEDQDALAKALDAARPKFDLLEWLIAGNGTVTGEFTIADCAVAPVLWRWQRLPVSLDPWPKVARLREALNARPSLRQAEFIA
jgi:glutathione S-transferase